MLLSKKSDIKSLFVLVEFRFVAKPTLMKVTHINLNLYEKLDYFIERKNLRQ